MCNGNLNRQSEGGTIAILRSTAGSELEEGQYAGELRFRQAAEGELQVIFRDRNHDHNSISGNVVVIHKDGDLTNTFSSKAFLHRFSFLPQASLDAEYEDVQMKLTNSMELELGPRGIVGRRISIYEDDSLNTPLAEGIIGWN